MIIRHQKYEIELKNDRFYSPNSPTNSTNYALEYTKGQIAKGRIYTINKRGVIIRDQVNGAVVSSAILCENGGTTEISENIFKVAENKLWICVGDAVYCLDIPALTINWFNPIEYGTNFSINHFNGDFIIHGDVGILRMSKTGSVKWKFMGGNGVFLPGEGKLKIFDKHIELIDGNNDKFVINEFGQEMD